MLFTEEPYPVLVVSSAVVGRGLRGHGRRHGLRGTRVDAALPLAGAPSCFIGVISYGIYLWHGPLMRIVQNAAETGRAWRLLAALIAIAVAALSYRFVEAPIRARVRRRTQGVRASVPGPDPAESRTTARVAETDAG